MRPNRCRSNLLVHSRRCGGRTHRDRLLSKGEAACFAPATHEIAARALHSASYRIGFLRTHGNYHAVFQQEDKLWFEPRCEEEPDAGAFGCSGISKRRSGTSNSKSRIKNQDVLASAEARRDRPTGRHPCSHVLQIAPRGAVVNVQAPEVRYDLDRKYSPERPRPQRNSKCQLVDVRLNLCSTQGCSKLCSAFESQPSSVDQSRSANAQA
jgi:hypothetical protein